MSPTALMRLANLIMIDMRSSVSKAVTLNASTPIGPRQKPDAHKAFNEISGERVCNFAATSNLTYAFYSIVNIRLFAPI